MKNSFPAGSKIGRKTWLISSLKVIIVWNYIDLNLPTVCLKQPSYHTITDK